MKLKYIDALRGLAIMGVLVVHCGQYGSNEHLPYITQSIILNGAQGVQLFYVASAFTLFLSLSHTHGPEKYGWVNFFIRRFFRIAPMYYLGICYYLWQDGLGERYWLADADHITPWNILSNFFFVHGFNPYWITSVVPGGWSIAVEMLFYCMIPLLFLKIRNTKQAFAFVLITLFLRAVLQFILNRLPLIASERLWSEYLYMYLPSQLPIFALGILLYFIIKEEYKLSIPPVLALLTFFVLTADLVGIPLLPNHFLFSIAFVVLAIVLSRHEFKIFVNPVFVHIGRVSYSMYLVHFAVLFWMNKMHVVNFLAVTGPFEAILNYILRLLVVTGFSVTIASFFYRAVELPLQRIGRKIIVKIMDKGPVEQEMAALPQSPVLPPGIAGDNTSGTTVTLRNEK